MIIKDLFSHKIHSSSDEWANKLIDIASIFSEFDGEIYDREAIENRLIEVSPRASSVGRDPSKFRDEISAYPAYLGLYSIKMNAGKWHIYLSETAKKFLVSEEPNVPAFMLLQLTLFQYPNGMGAAYYPKSSSVRVQSNTCVRTIEFIENNIHLSPLRLICKALEADSFIRKISPLTANISRDEVFALANDSRVNKLASPDLDIVVDVLNEIRNGDVLPPEKYESRFHILKHTDFLVSDKKGIRIRDAIGKKDGAQLVRKLRKINSLSIQFVQFDHVTSSDDLNHEIARCSWGNYFDGVKTIDAEASSVLTEDDLNLYSDLDNEDVDGKVEVIKSDKIYDLRQFSFDGKKSKNPLKKIVYTDPEITKIRRQKANLTHKIVLERLHSYLELRGASPLENEHIDLYAEAHNLKYVFEVKSITDSNLLSQSRKGVSQLYEYRYRYQDMIGYDVNLLLVFPVEPVSVPWLQKYLCNDRDIGVIWFDDSGDIQSSRYCEKMVEPLRSLSISSQPV